MYTKCLKIDEDYFIIDMINGETILSSRPQQETPDNSYEKKFHMSYPFYFTYDSDKSCIKIEIGTAKQKYIIIFNNPYYITNTSLKFNLGNDIFDNFKIVLHTLYKLIPIKPINKKDCYIVTFKDGTNIFANYVLKGYDIDDVCFLNLETIKGNTALFDSYNIQDIDEKFGKYCGAWPEYNSRKQKMFFNWINSNYLANIDKTELEIKQLKNKCWIIQGPLETIVKELNFTNIANMREYILERTGNKLGIFPEFQDKKSLLKFIKERKNEL